MGTSYSCLFHKILGGIATARESKYYLCTHFEDCFDFHMLHPLIFARYYVVVYDAFVDVTGCVE